MLSLSLPQNNMAPAPRYVDHMPCPKCDTLGGHIKCKGWNVNGPRPVVGIGGKIYYLWCQRFECSHPSHERPFSFLGYDPEVLLKLPDVVRLQFPCLLTRKFAIDIPLWDMILREIRNGHSFEDLSKLIKELSYTRYDVPACLFQTCMVACAYSSLARCLQRLN